MFDKIEFENFRCFGKRHEVRLTPLTFLVGENSSGKTSFLTLIHMLCELTKGQLGNVFSKEHFNLVSYQDIAHDKGGAGGQAKYFDMGASGRHAKSENPWDFQARFERGASRPIIQDFYVRHGSTELELHSDDSEYAIYGKTDRGRWRFKHDVSEQLLAKGQVFAELQIASMVATELTPMGGSPKCTDADSQELHDLIFLFLETPISHYVAAPVRSRPQRTYDPGSTELDPSGYNVPDFLAARSFSGKARWKRLKEKLEHYGKLAGLFDEIRIRRFGENESEPFQVQVKTQSEQIGSWRNLVDVGYGVSQLLPLLTVFARQKPTHMLLLQEPEVHLHPSAQAALGTLFCEVAGSDRMLCVETHSDFLIDRVLMDVRDKHSKLEAKDVSILFFERGLEGTDIRTLGIDEEGNIMNAPSSYGKFFMNEQDRLLGL